MKILAIGRDESCNIVLSDSTVSRRLAILKIPPPVKMWFLLHTCANWIGIRYLMFKDITDMALWR